MKLSDPADKATDAAADGNFGGKTNRRAGYSKKITFEGREYTEIEWITRTALRDGTLASGEGRRLVEHYESVIDEVERHYHQVWTKEKLEAQRLRDVLKRLREPSEAVMAAGRNAMWHRAIDEYSLADAIRAAVATAEQEADA